MMMTIFVRISGDADVAKMAVCKMRINQACARLVATSVLLVEHLVLVVMVIIIEVVVCLRAADCCADA